MTNSHITLNDRWRVELDPVQGYILARNDSKPGKPPKWNGVSFVDDLSVLLRCILEKATGPVTRTAHDALLDLPLGSRLRPAQRPLTEGYADTLERRFASVQVTSGQDGPSSASPDDDPPQETP